MTVKVSPTDPKMTFFMCKTEVAEFISPVSASLGKNNYELKGVLILYVHGYKFSLAPSSMQNDQLYLK